MLVSRFRLRLRLLLVESTLHHSTDIGPLIVGLRPLLFDSINVTSLFVQLNESFTGGILDLESSRCFSDTDSILLGEFDKESSSLG